MSKRVKMILIIIGIIILVGILMYIIPKKNVSYEVIKDGYSSYESQIISDYQQYLSFTNYINSQNKAYGKVYNFDANKYNEKYFNTGSLAIINIVTGSGMNKLKNINISINGNRLVCTANIEYAKGAVTDDINGKLILIEVDKTVTEFEINK